MRVMHNCLFSVISALLLYVSSFATELHGSNAKTDEHGSIVDGNIPKESVLTTSEHSGINSVLFKETESQDLLLPSQSVIDDPSFLNSVEVSSELSTTAEAVVFPSTDTGFELKNKVKSQYQNENLNNSVFNSFENDKEEYIVHAEPKVQVQAITEEHINKDLNQSESKTQSTSVSMSSQVEIKKTAPQHEDIPSFSEWTQKQLAEAEKKKTDQNETTDRFTKTRGKFRNKNYASPDCGAKIVAANPESLSSSAVLSPLKDEYMLNYCTNRIWFVVELCEAIQAKQLDLANFELFSSSPKYFSVFVSHRFPTRDWSNIGKFTAQDSRDVQTFNLHPHLFGKYIKVELHSHYGREQFCPISWVGIYGTSEFEVLAKEDERHLIPEDDDGDSYDEDMFIGHRRDSPKNLFSSATDAVLSIVKKATAPFLKTDNNYTESENLENATDVSHSSCICPRYITVCNNCSQSFYDVVFELLSCERISLENLILDSFVKRTLINSESCSKFGLNFNGLRTGAPFPINLVKKPGQELNYLTAIFKDSVVAALCNVLAVFENKVVVNTTIDSTETLKNVTNKNESCKEKSRSRSTSSSSTCRLGCSQATCFQSNYVKSSIFTEIFKPSERFSEKIEPTKTLTEDEVKQLPSSNAYQESVVFLEEKSTNLPSGNHVIPTATLSSGRERSNIENSEKWDQKVSFVETKTEIENDVEKNNKSSNATNQDSTLESIISDLNAMEKAVGSVTANINSVVSSSSNLPSESIFLRLANRIKNLEINMSLSSTYLEELSKRYRIQLDFLAKTLNLTIQKIEERSRLEEEKEQKREKEMLLMRMQLANLTRDVSVLLREKNSWKPRASSISQHVFFVFIEVFLVWIVFNYWRRSPENSVFSHRTEQIKKITKKHKRRKSLEGVKGHETPRRKTRRPSDEALEIALCRNYKTDSLKLDKKRKRKKKDSKCSINTIHLKRKKSEVVPNEFSPGSSEGAREFPAVAERPLGYASEAHVVDVSNRFASISSPESFPQNGGAIPELSRDLSSPGFLKTALAVRSSRLRLTAGKDSAQEFSWPLKLQEESTSKENHRKSSSSFKKYMKKFF